jgi:hypothetical protein
VLRLFCSGPADCPLVARRPSASLVFVACSSNSCEFTRRSFEVLGFLFHEVCRTVHLGVSNCPRVGRTIRKGSTDRPPSSDRPEASSDCPYFRGAVLEVLLVF